MHELGYALRMFEVLNKDMAIFHNKLGRVEDNAQITRNTNDKWQLAQTGVSGAELTGLAYEVITKNGKKIWNGY